MSTPPANSEYYRQIFEITPENAHIFCDIFLNFVDNFQKNLDQIPFLPQKNLLNVKDVVALTIPTHSTVSKTHNPIIVFGRKTRRMEFPHIMCSILPHLLSNN